MHNDDEQTPVITPEKSSKKPSVVKQEVVISAKKPSAKKESVTKPNPVKMPSPIPTPVR